MATATDAARKLFDEWLLSAAGDDFLVDHGDDTPENYYTLPSDVALEERGERWEQVVQANLQERLRLHAAVAIDPTLVPSVIASCSAKNGWRGCLFFIEHFGHLWEARARKKLPSVLYTFQVEQLVREFVPLVLSGSTLQKPIDLVIEKCRDMGATWIFLSIVAWFFIFVDGTSVLIGAQTEDDVDKGGKAASTETLFGRIRFILRNLPAWLWTELPQEHDKEHELKNPERNTLIVGEPVNENFGRKSRFTFIFVDEGAWCGSGGENMRAAHDACADSSRIRVWCSTPQGMNYFGQMRHGLLGEGLASSVEVKVATLRWYFHPLKNNDWIQAEQANRPRQSFAQNVLIDYSASVKGLVWPSFSKDKHVYVCKKPVLEQTPQERAGDLFVADLPLETAYDPGRGDAAAFGMWQHDRFAKQHRCLFYIERSGKVIDWFVPFYTGWIPEYDHMGNKFLEQNRYTEKELQAIELVRTWVDAAGTPRVNYGDQAGYQQTQNYALSSYGVLGCYGINPIGVKFPAKLEATEKVEIMLRNTVFSQIAAHRRWGDRNAKTLFECMTNYRWPEETETRVLAPSKPLHNAFSHGADMVQIYFWWKTVEAGVEHLTPRGDRARMSFRLNRLQKPVGDGGMGVYPEGARRRRAGIRRAKY